MMDMMAPFGVPRDGGDRRPYVLAVAGVIVRQSKNAWQTSYSRRYSRAYRSREVLHQIHREIALRAA